MSLPNPQPVAEQVATNFSRHYCSATVCGGTLSRICHIFCAVVLRHQAPRVAVYDVTVAVLPVVVPVECAKWRQQYLAAGVQAVRGVVVAAAAEIVYALGEHWLAAVKGIYMYAQIYLPLSCNSYIFLVDIAGIARSFHLFKTIFIPPIFVNFRQHFLGSSWASWVYWKWINCYSYGTESLVSVHYNFTSTVAYCKDNDIRGMLPVLSQASWT